MIGIKQKYQDLFFQSVFCDPADFFKQNKQQTGKNQDSVPPFDGISCLPVCSPKQMKFFPSYQLFLEPTGLSYYVNHGKSVR